MSSNSFSDVGLIFFVSWTLVLTRLSITALGRDLLPWRAKNSSEARPVPLFQLRGPGTPLSAFISMPLRPERSDGKIFRQALYQAIADDNHLQG